MSFQSSTITTAAAFLLLIPGCSPWGKPEIRQETNRLLARSGEPASGGGRTIAPKRNALKTAIISRPSKDPVINEKLWASADEQFLGPELQRVLHANGLRIGVISGSLPVETEAAMNEPPPNRVDPVHIELPDGDPAQVRLVSSSEPITLLLTRDGRTFGKDYADAVGIIRVSAVQDGAGALTLKITPEIHHGPVKKEFAAAPTSGTIAPQEFILKTGQQEEHFRDLTASVLVKPGQVVLIGGRPESGRDIGAFLFTEAESNSDRVKQKVLLVWANPNGAFTISTSAPKELPSAAGSSGR